MIKITQLLGESFSAYKLNLKKIFWIALPILILGIIGEYFIANFSNLIQYSGFNDIRTLIISLGVYVVTISIVALYYSPVLNRSIQKNEDGIDFDTKSAYNFQNKNIFKWIMLNIWGMLYMIWIMLPYIIINTLLFGFLFFNNISATNALIISGMAFLVFFTGIILNITKFILYKNIFFSKDSITTRDAVRESILLGVNKKSQVWLLILTLIIVTGFMLVIYLVFGFVFNLLTNVFSVDTVFYIQLVINGIISVLFFLPFMSTIIAKGYVKIRS